MAKQIPDDIKDFVYSQPDGERLALAQKLRSMENEPERLQQFIAKVRGQPVYKNTTNFTPQSYQETLPEKQSVKGAYNDLNDIQQLVNLLSTSDLKDVVMDAGEGISRFANKNKALTMGAGAALGGPAGLAGGAALAYGGGMAAGGIKELKNATSKQVLSTKDAETAGTYILNNKLNLPGVIKRNPNGKFGIEADVRVGDKLEKRWFGLDQNFDANVIGAIAAEGAQEGPRVGSALMGLAFVKAGLKIGTPLLGIAADVATNYAGNLAADKTAKKAYTEATEGKTGPSKAYNNPEYSAAVSTITDPLSAKALAPVITAGAKAVKSAAGGITDTIAAISPAAGEMLDNVGDFASKVLTGAANKFDQATDVLATKVQPLMEGVAKQFYGKTDAEMAMMKAGAGGLDKFSGASGNLAAIMSNMTKEIFDVKKVNQGSLEELMRLSSQNARQYVKTVNRIAGNKNISKAYQGQLRDYIKKIAKSAEELVSSKITGIKEGQERLVSAIDKNASVATKKEVAKFTAELETQNKNIENLKTQATQLGEKEDVISKELETFSNELQTHKQTQVDLDKAIFSQSASGIPKQDVGSAIATQTQTNLKGAAKQASPLYEDSGSKLPGIKVPEQSRKELQNIVDNIANDSRFVTLKGDKTNAFNKAFDAITEEIPAAPKYGLDREGGMVQTGMTDPTRKVKKNLNFREVADFQQLLREETRSLPEYGAVNRTGLHNKTQTKAVTDYSHQIKEKVMSPNRNIPDVDNWMKADELTAQSGAASREVAKTKQGQTFLKATSGVQSYDNFVELAKNSPQEAKQLFDNFSPDLQKQIQDLGKSERLADPGTAHPNVDNVIGIQDFTTARQMSDVNEKIAGSKTNIKDVQAQKQSVGKDIERSMRVLTGTESSLSEAPVNVAKDYKGVANLARETDPLKYQVNQRTAFSKVEPYGVTDTAALKNEVQNQVTQNQNLPPLQQQQTAYQNLQNQAFTDPSNFEGSANAVNKYSAEMQDPSLVKPAQDINQAAQLAGGLSNQAEANKMLYVDPNTREYMAPEGIEQAMQLLFGGENPSSVSNMADAARMTAATGGYAASGQASIGNLLGSGAAALTRAANHKWTEGITDPIGGMFQSFAGAPSVPMMSRLPVDQTYFSVGNPARVAQPLPPDNIIYNRSNPYRLSAEYNQYY